MLLTPTLKTSYLVLSYSSFSSRFFFLFFFLFCNFVKAAAAAAAVGSGRVWLV